MKTTNIKQLLLGIIFISSVSYANSSVKRDSTESKECLEVVGIAIDGNNENIDSVEVKLFKENEEMEWSMVTSVPYHDHNFKFILEENENYTIEISKQGFVKRSVMISTKLPVNISPKPIFRYEFDVMLFEEKKLIDDYYLDFPIALIGYNTKSGAFENNDIYTKHIKTKIQAESEHVLVENMMNGK